MFIHRENRNDSVINLNLTYLLFFAFTVVHINLITFSLSSGQLLRPFSSLESMAADTPVGPVIGLGVVNVANLFFQLLIDFTFLSRASKADFVPPISLKLQRNVYCQTLPATQF